MNPSEPPEPQAFDSSQIFACLERVNGAIAEAKDSEEMLAKVLDVILDIFDCDRAWLLYPCSMDAKWFQVPMERTRPEFPGAGATNEKLPINGWALQAYELSLGADGPVAFDAQGNTPPPLEEINKRFQIQSQLLMAIRPKADYAWLLGIHDCRKPKVYSGAIEMFRAIGHRVEDGLTSFLATKELRNSERHLRTVIDHAPEAIVILDCDAGHFIDANPVAEKLFGASRSEILYRAGPEDFSPEFQADGRTSAEAAKEYLAVSLAGEFPNFEWEHVNKAGNRIPCEVHLARLPHPERNLVRGSIRDISARKEQEQEQAELEARLAQSQKMEAIGNLTGGLAHDFNNLLTVILGNLDLLDMELDNPTFVAHQAAQIRAAAERAGSLTHRLLAFARQQPLRPRVISVSDLLRGMEDLLRRTIGEQIAVELVLGGGIWTCEVDELQLESAILNLAINARDAMPEGGRLTLETSNARLDASYASQHDEVHEGQYVLLAVSDSGTGMAPEVLAEIFAPFFTTKGPGKGTGLGLSMVYGFVRQSGGHVKAYSELGEGTTMKIYMPRSAQSAEALRTDKTGPGCPQCSGELILVVEDEESVRSMTLALLKQLGYHTMEASGVSQALVLLKAHPSIHMLLTDVVLAGDKTGAELAVLAKQFRPDLRVLYMSGYTENSIIHNGRLDPGVILLEKPFTKQALASRVREALAEG